MKKKLLSDGQVGIIGRNQAVEDVAYVLFSIFNVIWATIYLETWKRRGAELAYRWGTLDQRDDLLVEPRPLFTVKYAYNVGFKHIISYNGSFFEI